MPTLPGLTAYAAVCARLEAADRLVYRPGLERTVALLDALGNPQRGMRGVLVAGTNGKGSVCALLDSICRAAGLRSALLVKPHLQTIRERVCLGGAPVPPAAFAAILTDVFAAAEEMDRAHGEPSQFELLTAAGILAAHRAASDVLVCEVGMGGRLDSTNVLDLGLAVITNVDLDHERILGHTVPAIAQEKAAIIKRGNDVVTAATGEALDVIRTRAHDCDADLLVVGGDIPVRGASHGRGGVTVEFDGDILRTPLCGPAQIGNLGLAATAAQVLARRGLGIDGAAIAAGAASACWPGRLQWIDGEPAWLLDGAHNPAAMAALAAAIPEMVGDQPFQVIFGAMADKALAPMLTTLRSLTPAPIFTRAATARAAVPADLSVQFGAGAAVGRSVEEAIHVARRTTPQDGVVVVCGSLAVVGEALDVLVGPVA